MATIAISLHHSGFQGLLKHISLSIDSCSRLVTLVRLSLTPLDDPLSWSLILVSEFSMKDRVLGLTQVPLLRVVPVLVDDEYMIKQTTSRIQYIFTE